MSRLQIVLVVALGLVLLIVLSVVVSQVGGVSIRSASRTHVIGSLVVSNSTLLPGVPVTVTVETDGRVVGPMVSVLLLRLPTSSLVIREATPRELRLGSFTVLVPCDASGVSRQEDTQTRLVLVDNVSQAVLAQSDSLTLLPPGPDCVF